MIRKLLNWNNPHDQLIIQQDLSKNQVILGTSDTIIGLLAPLSAQGRQKLDTIKERQEKPYIVLIGTLDKISLFSAQTLSKSLQELLKQCWPGPLTLIVKAKESLDPWLISPYETIALRVPNHQGLLALLRTMPGVFSTSANKAGFPVPTHIKDVSHAIQNQCAHIIVDDKEPSSVPSTILDITGRQPRLIREGAYSRSYLEDLLETAL